tara:strand:+ start:455 stop:946 length:492 start_codon:yes stop_codon:yes gene_type:complete
MTILDNHLDKFHFDNIRDNIIGNGNLMWNHSTKLTDSQTEECKESYFTHAIFDNLQVKSPVWHLIKDCLLFKLPDFRTILRAKINLYPKQDNIIEHPTHVDMPFEHKGAILYLNTCDGFTRLDKDTIVESVENRLLLFDSSKPHNSTSTTTPPGRFNININYL